MAEVIEVNSLEELASYQLAWNALFRQTPDATFFHTYDWFVTFWQHHDADMRMRVLVVRAAGTTIGILPLVEMNQQHRLSTIRVLSYPLSDWGMWYGPLGKDRSAILFMAMQHIHDTPRTWDKLDLCFTSQEQGQGEATARAMTAAGWHPHREAYRESSSIQFAGSSWDAYLGGLSKKWRHEIRRQTRNLEREAEVRMIRHRPLAAAEGDGDPRWDLFEKCLEVSRGSWQANSPNGNTLCSESVLPFLRACHAEAARLGMLDLAILEVDGQPVAFQYNYHVNGRVTGLRMGYRTEMKDKGVGKVLLAKFIEESFSRGDELLDLGMGEYDYKTRFRTHHATSYRYSYVPWNALRAQGVRLSHWMHTRIVSRQPTDKGQAANKGTSRSESGLTTVEG